MMKPRGFVVEIARGNERYSDAAFWLNRTHIDLGKNRGADFAMKRKSRDERDWAVR